VRIGADASEGEFRHVGLGNNDGAGRTQTLHHGRIALRRLAFVGQDLGAGARHLAGDVEQVLDADDFAVEGPE
jgi:hypothetical protein